MLVVVGLALSLAAPGAAESPAPWLAPVRLGLGQEPVVAASADGDVVAAWRSVENGGVVKASFRPAGGRWQPTVEWRSGGGEPPRVAMDAAGDAIVVWTAFEGDSSVVMTSFRGASESWSAPTPVSAMPGWAGGGSARVGMDAAGDAFVAWRSSSSWPDAIQTRYRSAQTGDWSPPVGIESYAYSELELSVAPGGQALLVWDVSYDVGYGVAATVGTGGRWEQPAVVGRSREGDDWFTRPKAIAAAIADRSAVVAWQYSMHGNGIVEATVRPSGGTWEPPVDLSFTDGQAFSPAVAIDGAGNALAAWDASVDVEGTTRRAGSTSWDRPVVVSPSKGAPMLAMNARGDAIAFWRTYDSAPDALQAARRPVSPAAWGPTADVATGGRFGTTGVAIDGAGDAIAAWEWNDGGKWWIEVAASDIAAPIVAKLVTPKSGVVRKSLRFSVAARDTWSRVAAPVWTFGDGSRALGSTVTHRYRSPRLYRVTVTATDSLGHATTKARTVRIRS
jgi:hypothetical protein